MLTSVSNIDQWPACTSLQCLELMFTKCVCTVRTTWKAVLVHVCTMELVCVRRTHTVLCVCAFLGVVANACRLLKTAPKCQPFWVQLHVHFSIWLSFKDTILCCGMKYLVDSCSLPEYGFFNGTLFIVIDEIVSPVRFNPPCPVQWVLYKDLGNKTATLLSPAVCE